MILTMADLSPARRYFALTQSIIPRPVAWVLTENPDSSFNVAPFSYFSAVSSDPPLLMVSIGKKPDGSLKDSRLNIIERKSFVIHIAHRELVEAVTETSRSLPLGQSELDNIALETTPFEGFNLPRISACRVALACELYRAEDITATQSMILGRVVSLYLDDAIVDTGAQRLSILADKIDPIARLGGDDYACLGAILTVPRPK